MFAGVGGVCEACRQAGFTVSWANERDRRACITYRTNFPSHRLVEEDINSVSPADLGPVDVLTSGFPCQSFSVAGRKRLGFGDPERGHLFFTTARFIQALRPKAYLLENVRGLVNHDGGNTIRIIDETIRGLDYSFVPFILDAKQHGNVPQHRERIFIVGFRNEATGGPLTDEYRIPGAIPLTAKIGDCLSQDPVPRKYYLRSGSYMMPHFMETSCSRATLYQWRRSYVRENKSNVCPTLTANMGAGGNNVPFLFDKQGIRKLTPKETFNFQGFPSDFILPAGIADCHLYHQAGNSVAIPVVRRIAEELMRVLTITSSRDIGAFSE
jgi:DNA (cytosine-5)-methyltransferase 1